MGFGVGFLALCAAWFGGERFVLRQVRALLKATQRVGAGDLATRTGLANEKTELGQLARSFDDMAASLEEQIKHREQTEKTLAARAQRQTVVSALGQLALVTADFQELLNHATLFVAQTLEVEFSEILELTVDRKEFVLRAGTGWRPGRVGNVREPVAPDTQAAYALTKGEPVFVANLRSERRFRAPDRLHQSGVVSALNVAVVAQNEPYGVLGAYSLRPRSFTEDEVHFLLAIANVLSGALERKHAEAELLKVATFARLNPNPALELAADGSILYCNDAALHLAARLHREHPRDILPANIADLVRKCLGSRKPVLRLETKNEGRTLSWSFHPMPQSAVVHCYVEDSTERLNLEAQLRQSQKMESIGQLAAGVAHDFNNLLTIIQGHAGVLMSRPELPPKLIESSQTIFATAERAAGLTRQLLMFGRKNLMQPKPLDLRDVVGNLSKMLQRLLGEPVALQFLSPTELPLVEADTGMIEQVLVNLAVNARDAMPRGGKLILALSTVTLDDAFVAAHPQARTGRFVCLRVADTGCGMDAATLARIFEPFFTTKEPGKGTGLGLATVYGIIQQHAGWVEVESQVARGTTFIIYLPASNEAAAPSTPGTAAPAPAEVRGGTERILLVEDEPLLLELAVAMLEERGYTVVTAGTGAEALDAWQKHEGAFDLLLSDMVLPEGLSGLELAEQLRRKKAGLKIIFSSGYGMDDVGNDAVRRLNARFLQKPYPRPALAKVVREALDG
jgi:signal transduction histidine kinase/CheY-like chemotaxis protein